MVSRLSDQHIEVFEHNIPKLEVVLVLYYFTPKSGLIFHEKCKICVIGPRRACIIRVKGENQVLRRARKDLFLFLLNLI